MEAGGVECPVRYTVLDRTRHCKRRASTSTMPSFDVTSRFCKYFSHWLTSDWGGSKSAEQTTQTARRVLKFLRFCYPHADSNWNIIESEIDSSLPCTRQLAEFIGCVRDQWHMGYPGTIAYINSLGDAIDYSPVSNCRGGSNNYSLGGS